MISISTQTDPIRILDDPYTGVNLENCNGINIGSRNTINMSETKTVKHQHKYTLRIVELPDNCPPISIYLNHQLANTNGESQPLTSSWHGVEIDCEYITSAGPRNALNLSSELSDWSSDESSPNAASNDSVDFTSSNASVGLSTYHPSDELSFSNAGIGLSISNDSVDLKSSNAAVGLSTSDPYIDLTLTDKAVTTVSACHETVGSPIVDQALGLSHLDATSVEYGDMSPSNATMGLSTSGRSVDMSPSNATMGLSTSGRSVDMSPSNAKTELLTSDAADKKTFKDTNILNRFSTSDEIIELPRATSSSSSITCDVTSSIFSQTTIKCATDALTINSTLIQSCMTEEETSKSKVGKIQRFDSSENSKQSVVGVQIGMHVSEHWYIMKHGWTDMDSVWIIDSQGERLLHGDVLWANVANWSPAVYIGNESIVRYDEYLQQVVEEKFTGDALWFVKLKVIRGSCIFYTASDVVIRALSCVGQDFKKGCRNDFPYWCYTSFTHKVANRYGFALKKEASSGLAFIGKIISSKRKRFESE